MKEKSRKYLAFAGAQLHDWHVPIIGWKATESQVERNKFPEHRADGGRANDGSGQSERIR